MTKSSEGRKARRAAAQHEPEVTRDPVIKIPERPTSVIRFEQLNEQGGYTFSLGLWGALLSEMNPDATVPVSIVDIMALSIVHLIRNDSKDLQEAFALVRDTLTKVHENLEAGMDVEQVLRSAAEATGGTLTEGNSAEVPAETQA